MMLLSARVGRSRERDLIMAGRVGFLLGRSVHELEAFVADRWHKTNARDGHLELLTDHDGRAVCDGARGGVSRHGGLGVGLRW